MSEVDELRRELEELRAKMDAATKRADWLSGAYDAEKQRALDNARGVIDHWKGEAAILRADREAVQRENKTLRDALEEIRAHAGSEVVQRIARAALVETSGNGH